MHTSQIFLFLLCSLAICITSACDTNDADVNNASSPNAGSLDAGGLDAGGLDASTPDASTPDADAPDAGPVILSPPLRLFVTAKSYPIGEGITGADAFCNDSDTNPGDAIFKAFIAGSTRSICPTPDCKDGAEPVDWILQPTTPYTRLDGTDIFTTDTRALISWPLVAPLTENGVNQASGFNRDWTLNEDHCESWAQASDKDAAVGWTATLDEGFLVGGKLKCRALKLVCVEQP